MVENVTERLARRARETEVLLRRYLNESAGVPSRLAEALRYSIEAGGKRIRPALVLECCELCGGRTGDGLAAAAAIECVHTFSLIHDDLPCMDDAALRRGRPTHHKVFGEALAVLAGDALLALAFEILAREATDSARLPPMVEALAQATGRSGMIGGQVLDLEAEGRALAAVPCAGPSTGAPATEVVQRIHALKTASLMSAACRLGGLAAGGSAAAVGAVSEYGKQLGLAFQAIDDLLDVSSDAARLGKDSRADAAAGKQTLAGVVGVEEAWRMAELHAAAAAAALDVFGTSARPLLELARFVVERRY